LPSSLNSDPAFATGHLQETQDAIADYIRVGYFIQRAKFLDQFGYVSLAIAAVENIAAGFIKFDDAFRIQKNMGLLRLFPAEHEGWADFETICQVYRNSCHGLPRGCGGGAPSQALRRVNGLAHVNVRGDFEAQTQVAKVRIYPLHGLSPVI
jgi:hypothetical protein